MSKVTLPTSTEDPRARKQLIDYNLKEKELNLKAGMLGRFFGSNSNTPIYIVGVVSIFLLVIGALYTFIPESNRSPSLPLDRYWSISLPIVTTIIGYLFGLHSKNKEE